MEAVKDGFSEVANSFREIKKYRSLSIFLVSHLLFFDGVNIIGVLLLHMENCPKTSTTMNFVLLHGEYRCHTNDDHRREGG